MLEKTFKRGTRVTEAAFHDELERLQQRMLELCGLGACIPALRLYSPVATTGRLPAQTP
jgi:hypothetical protein